MKPTKLIALSLFAVLATQPACLLNLNKQSSSDTSPATTANQNNNGSNPKATPTPGADNNTAKAFFTNTVLPLLNTSCKSCHTIPAMAPAGAYQDIFVYSSAIDHMEAGTSSTSNEMYNAAMGTSTHSHGNLCTGTPALCTALKQWYEAEDVAANGNNPTGGPTGKFDPELSYDGKIHGWAVDTANVGGSMTVKIYNGPIGTGTLLATVTADQTHFNVPYTGNHGFNYQLPSSYIDGQTRSIYTYAIPTTGNPVQLTGSPLTVRMYAPKAAGQTYYNNTLKPQLVAKCQSCHSGDSNLFDYNGLFQFVAQSNNIAFTATATNNAVTGRALGNLTHGGGNICGGSQTAAPCAQLIQWFNTEMQ